MICSGRQRHTITLTGWGSNSGCSLPQPDWRAAPLAWAHNVSDNESGQPEEHAQKVNRQRSHSSSMRGRDAAEMFTDTVLGWVVAGGHVRSLMN